MFKNLLYIMLIGASAFCLADQAQADSAQKPTHLTLVDILLKYGSNSYFPTINRAMVEKDYEAVNLLIEHGVDLDTRARFVKEKYVNVRENKEFEVHHIGQSVLELAVEHGKKSLIKKLLSKGANPYLTRNLGYIALNEQGKGNPSCLYYESKTGKTAEKGDFNTTALYDVIMTENLELLAIFAEAGVNFNKACFNKAKVENFTPLQIAIQLKNKKIIQFLIDHGAKI